MAPNPTMPPNSVGEGAGRVWYAPWSSGSAYGLMINAGAKMTQMENRIVLARFKDGYGPVGAYFLHLKTYTQNCNGEEYESKWFPDLQKITLLIVIPHFLFRICRRYGEKPVLLPDAEPSDYFPVACDVFLLEIIQKPPALTDHFQQAAA